MHVLHALDRFVVQLEADGRAANTVGQYRRHLRAIASWLALENLSCEVEAIDHETIARFLASDTARTCSDGRAKSPGSMNALRTSLRCFFQFACRAGYVGADPARLVRRARCGPSPPRGLSDAEERRLLAILQDARGPEAQRDRVLIELMLATGLRLGSALGLDVDDVNLAAGELRVRVAKGDRPQTTFLSTRIVTVLQEFIGGRRDGPLFATRSGRRVSRRQMQRLFGRWREQAGISATVKLHSLRHAFAQKLYGATSDLFLVQHALNHRAISSTAIYARMDSARLRDAISHA